MYVDEGHGSVEFYGERWNNDTVLAKLEGREVNQLHLIDTEIDDFFFQRLQLKELSALYLKSSTLTDVGISDALRRFSLQSLRIFAPGLTDRSMRLLSECLTINELSLVGSRVTDEGIRFLAQMPSLFSLDISHMPITDKGISAIASTTIDQINFENCPVTGIGFSTWNVFEQSNVNAKGSLLTDDGFGIICEAFAHLWEITISETTVSDEGLKSIANSNPINEISVCNSKVSAAGIEWLIENRQLENLHLDSSQLNKTLPDVISNKEVYLSVD